MEAFPIDLKKFKKYTIVIQLIGSLVDLCRLDCLSIRRNPDCRRKKSQHCRTISYSFAMLSSCSLRLVQLEVWVDTLVSSILVDIDI